MESKIPGTLVVISGSAKTNDGHGPHSHSGDNVIGDYRGPFVLACKSVGPTGSMES